MHRREALVPAILIIASALAEVACGGRPAAADAGCSGTWLRLDTATAPPARCGGAAIYDPVRDRVVVFGGRDGATWSNQVWALNLSGTPDWSLLTPGGVLPSVRAFHSATYDPLRDRMVVMGGTSDAGTGLNDIWALSLAGNGVWTRLDAQANDTPALTGHRAVYDVPRDRMVTVFGYEPVRGYDSSVWTFSPLGADVGSWSNQWFAGPHGRTGPGAALDAARERMLMVGGYYRGLQNHFLSNIYLKDAWWLDLHTPEWVALQSAPPLPRGVYGPSAIVDAARDRVVLFGGSDDSGASADVLALALTNGTSWETLTPGGVSPPPRNSHSAVYGSRRDRMVVFGGCSGTAALNDTWILAWPGCAAVGVPQDARGELPLLSGARVRPLPAAGAAMVDFALGRGAYVELQVFDLAGRRVYASAPARTASGPGQLVWDPSPDTRSGIYHYVLSVRDGTERARASGVIVRTR